MTNLNILGSFSGIGMDAIEQLMEAERAPLKQLSNKKDDAKARQDAWRDVNTRLNSLYERLNTLGNAGTFTSKTSSSTNDEIVSMSVGNSAPEGVYNIKVNQLATSSRVIGDKLLEEDQEITDELGLSGIFKIENHDGEFIEIEVATEDSLKDIVKNINKGTTKAEGDDKEGKSIGVKATIVDGRIVLTDEKTGARDIKLDRIENPPNGDILKDLKLNKDLDRGQNAQFNINGIDVTSDSNEVKDVLEGVTINLNKEHEGNDSDTVTIGADTEKAIKAVEDFVKQYNSTMKFIEEQLEAGDPEKDGSRGALAGDGALMRLQSKLRTMVTGKIEGAIKDISELGVSTVDRYGQLQFDSSKLVNKLMEDPNQVIDFFKGKEEDGGYSSRLNEEINYYIAKKSLGEGKKGMIKSTMDRYDNLIKDLNRQIDNFNDRMEKREAYYIRTFAALDQAMMQAESQMAWMEQQLMSMYS